MGNEIHVIEKNNKWELIDLRTSKKPISIK